MDSEAIEKFGILLMCPVCYEDYSDSHPPITLLCGHTICRVCTRILKRGKKFIKCPIDKTRKKMIRVSVNTDYLALAEGIRNGKFVKKYSKSTQHDSIRSQESILKNIQKLEEEIKESENYNLSMMKNLQNTLGKIFHHN